MLKLTFSAEDIARTRFASSPLWEVVTSVQALKEPGRHVLHVSWSQDSQRQLARQRVSIELLSALVPIPSFYVPDFLTPVPDRAAPTIEEELAGLANTSVEVVRADLDRMVRPLPPSVAELYRDPATGLTRLVREIRAYWNVALLPHWARIGRLVDGEVLYRARAMAQGGAAGLFQDLHPQVHWQDATLRIAHPAYEATRTLDTGHGLVLVPSVFVWPGVFSQSNPPGQPGLVYPPHGVGALWNAGLQPVSQALVGVVGHSRARLLVELGVPASTTEIASRLDMSTPNVSHHLTALRRAGLVMTHRSGHSVLYVRTAAAEALLAASEPI